MDTATVSAFGDELEKIAMFGAMGKAVSRGWHYPAGMWTKKVVDGGKSAWEPAQKATFMGKGKITKYLPVGDKSFATGVAALGAPSALAKEDPSGQGRSRTERVSGLVGSTLGGFAGAGALGSLSYKGNPVKALPVARSLVGAVGGSILGERMATAPSRYARTRAEMPVLSEEQRAQLLGQVGAPQ